MQSMFIIDTNVLLHDPSAIYKFDEHEVIIPIVVVEEVDKFKREQSEVGRNARTISRLLDEERQKGCLSKGVPLKNGGSLKVIVNTDQMALETVFGARTNDDLILGAAVYFARNTDRKCVLVTKDTNLRIKADALGIKAEDYFNDKIDIDDLYNGWTEKAVDGEILTTLEKSGQYEIDPNDFYRNQFVKLSDTKNEERTLLARVTPEGNRLVTLSDDSTNVWGIQPRNLEQRLAIELLLDPEIKLVSLIGKAGTGKTLLALAAGLQMVIDDNKYNRLIVARPIYPLGRDLGYLPGDIDEKVRPWMQPIFDNLEYILHCNAEELTKSQITHQYFIDKGWIVVEPLTYIRGRSIPNQYLLVDEAQNLTPHETKSIITRAGHGTKIVLTGDPHQIDNPFLDASSNGISYLVQRLKNQSLYGHISLIKGERSELAECASNLL